MTKIGFYQPNTKQGPDHRHPDGKSMYSFVLAILSAKGVILEKSIFTVELVCYVEDL